jgi:hypothetical protein
MLGLSFLAFSLARSLSCRRSSPICIMCKSPSTTPIVSSNPRSACPSQSSAHSLSPSVSSGSDGHPARAYSGPLDRPHHRLKLLQHRRAPPFCEYPPSYLLRIRHRLTIRFLSPEHCPELPGGRISHLRCKCARRKRLYLFYVRRHVPTLRKAMYVNLGVGWATMLLGLLGCVFVPIPILLYKYGECIRMASKCARHDYGFAFTHLAFADSLWLCCSPLCSPLVY